MKDRPDNLEMTNSLFSFLQGNVPKDCKIKRSHMPKLTPDQAWTVIWFLGNQYWQVTDHVEKCDVCGELFDTWNAGEMLDYGKAPYHFCDDCRDGELATKKRAKQPKDKSK